MRRLIFLWLMALVAVAASNLPGTALAGEAFGGRLGFSDSYGLLSDAIGKASTRAVATRPLVPHGPCMKWETLWRSFPYFDYVAVRTPCSCPCSYY